MTHTPTPAEIETLRKALHHFHADGAVLAPELTESYAILDRLSPPEPEQPDEATVWTRKVLHAEYQITAYATGEMDDRAQFINARQVLSELIASKDAEADAKVKYAMDRLNEAHANKPDWERLWAEQTERAEKAESELAALRAENERLDASSENYKKLYAEYWGKAAVWYSENERLKADCARLQQALAIQEGVSDTVHEALWASRKAAERNTAEPALDGETSVFPPSSREGACALADRVETSATNTTPEVVRMTPEYLRGYAAEFEARGRREALECAQYIAEHVDDTTTAKALQPIIDELKRLMTEGK